MNLDRERASVWGVRNRNRYLKKVPTLFGPGLSGSCLVGGHDSQKPQRREHVSDGPFWERF